MDTQQSVQPKGKRKAVSNLEEERIGRDAFFKFIKEGHEMGELGNAKWNCTKVKEEILNKWNKLNPKEKAAYGSAIEGPTLQVNDEAKESSFMTRCSPERLHRTVEKLSADKRLAITGIGFGNLASLSCSRLHRPLCNFLIERFNPETSSIELHGKVLAISGAEFGHVMGLKNTGEDVELGGVGKDENVKQLVKRECGNGQRVLLSDLAEKLEKCEHGDDDFKVRFVMFALGTVLCSTSSLSVNANYLTCLSNPGKIQSMNWADHAFNVLREGVRSFKKNKAAYVNGSLLFLQLFYFDSIVHGRVYVDKSLDPIMAWDNNSATKLIKWVRKQGGFDSPTIGVVLRRSRMNVDSGVNIDGLVKEVAAGVVKEVAAGLVKEVAAVVASIIEAQIRPVLELSQKVMTEFSSFMKDARQNLRVVHGDVNESMGDGPLKKTHEVGENFMTKNGEESTKLNVEAGVNINKPSTPLPEGHSGIKLEFKSVPEKRKVMKFAHGDGSGIKTRRTVERRPSHHRKGPWVDPTNTKGKAVRKMESKIKVGPFKLTPGDLDDADLELFSYIFRSNNSSSEEILIDTGKGHHVTRGELLCLRPEMWLNEQVINTQVVE